MSLLSFLGTINIMVVESSKDIETGDVMDIFSFLSFLPKIYPAKIEKPLLEEFLYPFVESFTEVNKVAS
jgi:hypothetical protein